MLLPESLAKLNGAVVIAMQKKNHPKLKELSSTRE